MAERHLALADRHVVESEERVTRQHARVARLAEQGHDTATAEELLATLLAALDGMHAHRATILAEVAAEEGGRG